jgi:hypothetical protein
MKTIKISILALAMVFIIQLAKAQVRIGVSIGYPAPYYHRVAVARPYGYYEPTYYRPYVYDGYYARPVYHPYYRGRFAYRRRW